MPTEISKLVLGTHNRKKRLELECLLAPMGIRLCSLADYPHALTVEETGETFIENARLKACQQAIHLQEWTIGEDSGLCVPLLGGQPGVYSARYAGPQATDEDNNAKLLSALQNASDERRNAYYISTIALSDPHGAIHLEAEGRCWGRILTAGRGTSGFGYDPLFEIPEYHQTFAELGLAVKAVLSHRARALEKFLRGLRDLLAK